MFEEIGMLLNSHPLLWALYGILISAPLVGVISYFFWPKESDAVGQRKKTDLSLPDKPAKDDISDSGIEASGEMERSSVASISEVRGVSGSPDSLRPESVDSNSSSDPDVTPIQHGHAPPNDIVAEISVGVTDAVGVSETDPEVSSLGDHGSEVLTLGAYGSDPVTFTDVDSVVIGSDPEISRRPVEADDEEDLIHDLKLATEVEHILNLANGGVPVMGDEQNGVDHTPGPAVDDLEVESSIVATPLQWTFPPVLEDFDLMESDVDPSQLEEIFSDDRLIEVKLRVNPTDGPGVGISIVGGSGSPSGDLPIIVKRVLPGSLAEREGRLKSGDELVAVNENLLVGMNKTYAIDVLSRMEGDVRLLVLQDD